MIAARTFEGPAKGTVEPTSMNTRALFFKAGEETDLQTLPQLAACGSGNRQVHRANLCPFAVSERMFPD